MSKAGKVISPMEFLRELVGPVGGEARAWITSFPDADDPSWQGRAIRVDDDREFSPRLNHYVSTAAFPPKAKGRTIENMIACVAIVVDDPTTKGDAAKLFRTLGKPTARVQTSEGNYQWWYFLTEGATAAQVRPVLEKVVALGLGDKSGNNAARYARIHCGVNNKREHGEPFGVHMVEWTGNRFGIDEIAEALGAAQGDLETDDDDSDEPKAIIQRASDGELERLIKSGESFHGPMVQLTARAICNGELEKDALRRLRALMFESEGQDNPKRKSSWEKTLGNIPRMLASAKVKFPQGAVRSQLRRGDGGSIIADEENVRLIVEHDSSLAGMVRYDELSMRRVLVRPVPGDTAVVASDEYPRQWRDEDSVAMQQYVQRHYMPRIGRDKVDGALGTWARSRWSFHPIRDYLKRLEWDGKPRLDDWLTTYLQAKGAPEAYLRAVGAKWMIAAIARVIEPGCQADYALVLEGGQGKKKSSALRALAGDEHFSDSLPGDLSSKDAADHIRGKWIIELPELAQFRKSEIETVKAFITRRVERFRPAFGRFEIEYPRQCVFAGTTNEDQYLIDDTGDAASVSRTSDYWYFLMNGRTKWARKSTRRTGSIRMSSRSKRCDLRRRSEVILQPSA
ncbi:hypothetical protein ACG33_08825 [Steroidobacter denitrificans]|uniref:Virulence-associated protein E-like domain-containing protein n=1 Tax=Steroidobacter denitrificans TaxID=465721 RepID=A0A127FC77_STEDE|nr:VapE domain-containing protein [Steroidobacter denitrificans]AMN47195.1 hypothetical protein ACG33_08825 [Steroidobacter denitrificans]